jgi:hypothetical protein
MMDIKIDLNGKGTATRSIARSKLHFSDVNTLETTMKDESQQKPQFQTRNNSKDQNFWDVTWPLLVQDGWKLVRIRYSLQMCLLLYL